ncbi:hypothetical protein ADK57_20110 [Streptomyces sp. MMG1533]|nr:hypothetical protein ADK57_20110 [Streptomyces sp. MMG1533]
MRTAAGRRALQVALLVGGLFALGFLCGEQAHAADGVLSTTSRPSVTSATSMTSTTSAASTEVVSSDSAHGVRSLTKSSVGRVVSGSDDDQVVRPVARHVVRSVDTRVAQPVGRLVGTVVTGLAEVEAKLPALPGSSELPSLPDPSDLPGPSELPGMPGLPALPGQTLPAPVTSTPQPGSPAAPSATDEQDTEGSSAAAMPLTYGPWFAADAAVTGGVADPSAHRAGPAVQAPVQQAPPGDPGDALSGKSAVDNGTPRHGDAHAVTGCDRAPVRLVAGVAARAAADSTRDRYRDIPVFPG